MPHLKLTRRAAGFQHILDQINPAPRRIQVITPQQKRGAGRGTHAAMDATAQNAVALGNIRVSQLGGGEKGLHETTITHNIGQWQKRGRCPQAPAGVIVLPRTPPTIHQSRWGRAPRIWAMAKVRSGRFSV
jgi:hypothetical protein